MKNCRKCGADLVVGENITHSRLHVQYNLICKPCKYEHEKKHVNKKKASAASLRSYKKNGGRERQRERLKDPEKLARHKASTKKSASKPSVKAKKAAGMKKWRKENPGKVAAYTAKRRAQQLKATPPWADDLAIEQFYVDCPKGHEVDHIAPLQGTTVSGLHVLENLQYLSISENRSKTNHWVA